MPRSPCPSCGSYNEDSALFCDQCGAGLRSGKGKRKPSQKLSIFSVLVLIASVFFFSVLFLNHANKDSHSNNNQQDRKVVPGHVFNPEKQNHGGSSPVSPGLKGKKTSTGKTGLTEVHSSEYFAGNTQDPILPEKGKRNVSLWASVTAYNQAGERCFSCLGVMVEENLLLCRVEVLVNAVRIEVRIGEKDYICRATAGWDLERGYCLLSLPFKTQGIEIGSADVGDKVTALTGAGKKNPCVIADPALYGVDQLACYVISNKTGFFNTAFLMLDKQLLAVEWYRWPLSEIIMLGRLSDAIFQNGPEISISQWNNNVWRESGYDYLCRGRDSYLNKKYRNAAGLFVEALKKNPELFSLLNNPLASSYIKWAAEKGNSGDLEKAIEILKQGLDWLGESKEILFLLSREEASAGFLKDSLLHMRRALATDENLWRLHWPLLEKRYSQFAESLEEEDAIEILYEGIRELPESIELRIKLGGLLFKKERYRNALQVWGEAYDLNPDPEIANLMKKAQHLAEVQNEIVIIPFSGESQIVHAVVTFERAVDVNCIIDTGASYTAIPKWAAKELGIDFTRAKSVRIATASGVKLVPIVTLDSIGIGNLEVSSIEVLILDLPHPSGQNPPGLLGMNFLRNFHVTLDRDRKELRISPREP